MLWFSFTPESIPALVEMLLAGIIAAYLFSLKNKSFVLWLLAFSLVGEFTHHLVKLISFSVPALYQSATPLLGVSSIFIFTLLVLFAYRYRERLYEKEERIVVRGFAVVGTLFSIYLIYIFASARPHDQIPFTQLTLYSSLSLLLLTAGWAIWVLLRKAHHFKSRTDWQDALAQRKAVRACYAFASVFSLKILIILASILSSTGVIGVGFRIYTNLVFHIFYLSGLTVVIIDHLRHPTSLQMKLVGLSLSSVLLILSIAGLSIYSTRSLLERSMQFIPDRYVLRFSPDDAGTYKVSSLPYQEIERDGEIIQFGSKENIVVALQQPFYFYGEARNELFVNRHGLVAFDEPFQMAPPPVFYLEQLSPPFKSTLHWEAFSGPPFIAALHVPTDASSEAAVRVLHRPEAISITWEDVIPAFPHRERRPSTFGITFYADGRVDLRYALLEAYLHEGLVGIHPGENKSTTPIDFARLASQQTEEVTADVNTGLIYDLGKQFRSFVHLQVLPLFWIILGALLFVLLIFPVALRASVLRPLGHLLAGVRRVDDGQLNEPVRIVTQDEIGNVATGFNEMMASLQLAHQQLVDHADHLEDEVALRTDEIRQQKQVLEEQALRLRELDEMKSRFFANISHEFRTPLNLIMGPLQRVLDGEFGTVDKQLGQQHSLMLGESHRLLKLINQLLDLSKMEAGRMTLSMQPADLVSIWRRILHSFSSRAEIERKTLTFHSEIDQAPAQVDVERMEQIGYNLMDNALKYTEAGGKVHVSITQPDPQQVTISVNDTGVGIPSEEQALIFDRFHQVKENTSNNQRGTGIGLALVQELVFLHDGHIALESEPGFGSKFMVTVPIDIALVLDQHQQINIEPIGEAVSVGAQATHEQPLGKIENGSVLRKRILIVDDDEEFCGFVADSLSDVYDVVQAEDGKAGLTLAVANPPHLIVSDLLMPEMDGIAFCEAVKRHPDLDHTPFILLTAKTNVESRIEGLQHGADDYLGKPVDPRELRTRVQNLLQQRQHLIEKYTQMTRLGHSEMVVESADAVLLQRIVDVIEQRLDDAAFSVTLLAEELGMSVRDVQRKLKKLLDLGPKELITNLRIEKAKQLLSGNAGTVSQIAYKVGFSRPEYFIRIFKQHTGQTPGQFMKGNRKS